jgi:hypothetical protein
MPCVRAIASIHAFANGIVLLCGPQFILLGCHHNLALSLALDFKLVSSIDLTFCHRRGPLLIFPGNNEFHQENPGLGSPCFCTAYVRCRQRAWTICVEENDLGISTVKSDHGDPNTIMNEGTEQLTHSRIILTSEAWDQIRCRYSWMVYHILRIAGILTKRNRRAIIWIDDKLHTIHIN